MANLGAWNIKGLNWPLKQKEVKLFIGSNKIDVMVILEMKVKKINMDSVKGNVFGNWEFVHSNNINFHGRIWVA